MRELHYGTGVITVSFDVCSAVFDYTVALANAGKSDRITVPVMAGGARGFSNLLLGPATQLYCTATIDEDTTGAVDLDDAKLVELLRQKTNLLSQGGMLSASSASIDRDSGGLD
ncbi:hypothetical protein KPL76_10785 [Subtercola sp. PAMC28395]|uniref:hypothetical protein n=1 Tax=Subtercola sp. PAMC28395 TaxID=2846775 RepID=UPI001C0C5FB1|nr:hypothetical protein [Subtercola sp. PAMC28395]QWT23219.1 hypothetical protein KPL76_10785 [Subtercola sp. PAMC28395]